MKTRYLITGASGYIGYHLAKHAAGLGHGVSVLGRARSNFRDLESLGVRVYRAGSSFGEVRDVVEASGATCIMHLAGEGKGSHEGTDIASLIEANVTVGAYLIEAAIQSGCNRLISAGTYWEFGESQVPSSSMAAHQPSGKSGPNSMYAACKAAFSGIARYASQYRGLVWKQLVLYDVYGPHDWREKLLPRLVKQALSTLPPTSSDKSAGMPAMGMSPGEQLLDFIHVDDVVRAFMHASEQLEQGVEFPTVTGIRSEKLLTLRQAIGLLEESLATKLNVEWGKHPYMQSQIFKPHLLPVLPGWQARKKFPEGILE